MEFITDMLGSYSTKKLKQILEKPEAYNLDFIDHLKDELIRRGEDFKFNDQLTEEIEKLNDSELKLCVEEEWQEYHLEYLEIARSEYLKRGFKNTHLMPKENPKEKYPALRILSSIYYGLAWVIGITGILYSMYCFSQGNDFAKDEGFYYLIIGLATLLGMLAFSEIIRVILDIEKNTR